MGKIEKLIVLGVLFLITIILVVTFSTEDPVNAGFTPDDQFAEVEQDLDQALGTRSARIDRERTNPGDLALRQPEQPVGEGSPESLAGEEASNPLASQGAGHVLPGPRVSDPQSGTEESSDSSDAGTALLSTGVTLDKPIESASMRKETLMQLPDGAALVSIEGLTNSFLEDFKLYTWESGDTYRALAARFYGDANRSSLLRQYNEDRYTVEPGMQIFVPVFDVESNEVAGGGESGGSSQDQAGYHVVADGESLWTIAREVYGAGSKWQMIADANKDVLPDPHDLTPGVRLRLP